MMASLFGISDGAARTCLWRMVSNGELTSDDGTYALAGNLTERRERVDEASRIGDQSARPWDGTWELAIVSLDRRSAADRLALRKAATALHLAEMREGVWLRPDNLDPARLPRLRAVLDQQCVHFHQAATDIDADTVRSLFNSDDWARDARRLTDAMRRRTRHARQSMPTTSPISSHCRSRWSAICNATRCCPTHCFPGAGRDMRYGTPTADSTKCSNSVWASPSDEGVEKIGRQVGFS